MHTPIVLTLAESTVLSCVRANKSFSEYKLLAEWLDCYQYILPANQHLDYKWIHMLAGTDCSKINSTTDIHMVWWKCLIVENALSRNEQERILQWIPLQ